MKNKRKLPFLATLRFASQTVDLSGDLPVTQNRNQLI